MSSNQLVQVAPAKTLLSLNIRNLDKLFSGFNEGDFAIIQGSASDGKPRQFESKRCVNLISELL
jgi:hypothetical protein